MHYFTRISALPLSTDQVLDGSDKSLGRQNHSGILEPGASYTVSNTTRVFKLPEGISGDYYFIVRTDAGKQVYESALAANNTSFDPTPTKVFLTPPPDLEISVDAPSAALASHNLTVNYRLSNYGATATPYGRWTNAFYLSSDNQLDSSDLLLDSRIFTGSLDLGEERNQSVTLTLPNGIAGKYYLFAKADSNDNVFELDNDNNTAFDPVTIDSKPADLVVSEVTAPEVTEAGTGTQISWTVINQGTGDTVKTNWNDRLLLSVDSVIGNSDDRILKTFTHNGLLKAGESYSNNELITVPFDLQGNYQLYIQSDVSNSVYEANNEGNNTSVLSPLAITRKTPDLQVTAVNAPLTGVSGESLVVNWSVANLGTGKTNSNYWYDEVFLSLDRDLGDSSDISLGKLYHSGSLDPNGKYDASHTFKLPQNLDKNYYAIVRTDTNYYPGEPTEGRVLETPLENNNATAATSKTSISLNTVPDLVIEQIDAPAEAISGQSFNLNWTIRNQGAEVNHSWHDVFYLSRDQVFDRSSDIYLGSSFHYGKLAAGAETSKTASFNIPRGLSGPFYVFAETDNGNDLYERNGEDNNIAFDGNSTNVILPPPADLVAEAISVPTEGVPGQNVTLNYTVANQGNYTVDGNWEDAIYLSEDNQWDINDPLIEKVRVYDSLDSGESYSRTVNASLPGVATGDYHVIVRSDIRDNVYESQEDNNLGVSAEQININTELLELGSFDTDIISPGKSIYYRIEATAGQAIRIKLNSQADSSNNNVYVRHEQMPTKGQFDFFTEPFTSDPELVFPVEQDGTYYVLVSGDNSSAATNYTITAEEIPFSLLDVNTKKVGNVAPFTLELKGAKFDADNTIFQIVDEEGTIFEATQIVLKDSTTGYATFDLSGQPVGNYDIRAIQDGETIEVLEDILIVEDGVDAELFSSIDGPGVVRPGGKYLVQVNYANAGGADEAAPLIILRGDDTPIGLSSNSVTPRESLFLLGVGEDLGVDTLRPGEINQIPFFFSAGSSVNVNMLRYTEDSSTPITEDDWNLIETAIKPSEISEDDWNVFWSSIQPRIGNTWGDYVQVVNDLAKSFSPNTERDYDVRELFTEWYESGDLSVYTPKSFVSGRLIDTDTGEPLSNVELQLYQEIDGETIQNFNQITTDSEGRFSFSTLPPGDYKLAILGDYSFVDSSVSDSNAIKDNLDIVINSDITNLELETTPYVSIENDRLYQESIYQDNYLNGLFDDFSSWIQEEINNSSTSSSYKEISVYNIAAKSQSSDSSDELTPNEDNRFNLFSKTYNLPFIGKIKAKRQLIREQEDIITSGDGNTRKQSGKIQEKVELSFKGLEEKLGFSLPKIRYSVDGKATRILKKEDCEWRDEQYKVELGGSVLETKFKLETANSLVTLFIPEPLRELIVNYVVAGGDAFTTFSTNIFSGSREFTRDAQTGEITVKDKWKPSVAIEQFFGKEIEGIKYGIFIKAKTELQIVQGQVDKSVSTTEFYLNLPLGGKGWKTKLEIKDGTSVFSSSEISITSEEFSRIELPSDLPIPLPPGDDNPSLPPGFSALEFLQSPEEFVDFPEPPPIEDCDDDHDEDDNDGDLDDYNPAVLISRDPNDILGPEGFGEQQWINADNPLGYTIRFENDPKLASAPAQVVRITQQLDRDLDFRTFRVGDFGFGDTFIDVPNNRAFYQTRLDLVAEKGIYVDVFAGIDIAKGEAFWELRSIDPATGEQPSDPLLGFLPPNLTKPEGDGFVSYTIKPDRQIESGTVIDAEATIVFDINEPIDTPAILNTIDAGKPTSTVNALPQISESPEFTVSWTGSDDENGSAIALYTIYVAQNGGEYTPWLANTTLTEANFTGIPGSSYEFYAVARDNAGNVQNIPTTAQAVISIAGGNNPPVLLNPIGTQTVAEDSNFSLTITEDIFIDNDEGEVLTYTATLTDGSDLPSWLTFDVETRTFSGTPSNEDLGNLNIIVTVTDKEGETVSDTFELKVLNVNDAPTLETAIANQIATEDKAFSFTFPVDTFNDVDSGDNLTYRATLADGNELPPWLTFNAETRIFNGTPVNENVGTLNLKVTAADNDGKTVSNTFDLEVANVNDTPTLKTAIANQTATEDKPFNFTFSENTFNDVDARDSLTYTATLANGDKLPSWLAFNAETRTFNGTPVNENVGTLSLRVTAIDNSGELVNNIFELEVANVNDAPTLKTAIANQVATEDEEFSFTFPEDTFKDIDAGDSLTYTATNADDSELPSWLSFDAATRTFSGTPVNEDVKNLSIKVTATDNDEELVSNTFELEVVNVNDTPTLKTAIANQVATEDKAFSFTFPQNTFNDVDSGDNLTYRATLADGNELPPWLAFNAETRAFSGTPLNENVGNISLRVIATDNSGEAASDTFDLEVANVNDAPTLETAIANQTATEDKTFSFTWTANTFNDVDTGDRLTYRATLADGSELPSWLSFDAATRTFSGTPLNEDVGKLNLKVTAIDNSGESVNNIFELEVVNVNDTPTLKTAIANQTATEDKPFNFAFSENTFNDVDAGDRLTYTATLANGDKLPSWLAFNAETRAFSGTPLNENVGNLSLRVTATDNSGESVNNIFELEVANVNDAPTLETAIANQATKEDEAFKFTFPVDTFKDIDVGDSLTYSASNADNSKLPNWLTFNPETRTLSGTPANENVGKLNIKLVATDNHGERAINTFDLEVINVNDTPLDINLSNSSINENSSNGTIIGNLSTLDPDVGDTHSYTLTNSADGRFTLDGNKLLVAASNRLDFETNKNHLIEVKATDKAGSSLTKNLTINLNNLNEAPVLTDDSVTANSSSAKVIANSYLLSNDRDPENQPLSLIAVSNVNGGTVSRQQNTVSFTPATNFNGTAYFQYTASDGVNSSTATVKVEVGVTQNGSNKDDTWTGTKGDDLYQGLNGNDILSGEAGDDVLSGDNGNDTLIGGLGNDSLSGNNGNDELSGDAGNDLISGDNGNDTLIGGLGNDTINGGKGNDVLVFNNANQGVDTITDFSVKDDTLVFSAAGFGGNLVAGKVSSNMFILGTAATSSSHRFIYNVGNGDFFYDSDGTGQHEQIKIAQLDSGLSLGSDNLLVG